MKAFKKSITPDLPFKKAKKKPIPVHCAQIAEPFEVETLEGTMKGKAGDWLIIGTDGEMWVVDVSIFAKTYDLL